MYSAFVISTVNAMDTSRPPVRIPRAYSPSVRRPSRPESIEMNRLSSSPGLSLQNLGLYFNSAINAHGTLLFSSLKTPANSPKGDIACGLNPGSLSQGDDRRPDDGINVLLRTVPLDESPISLSIGIGSPSP